MEEIGQVARAINQRIAKIEELCSKLDEAGDYKTESIANYDKAMAIASLKLWAGKITGIDNEPLEGKPPATLIPILAKGLCFDEKMALEQSTSRYKSLHTKIDALSATLNAKQSIYRHLDKELLEKT